MKRCVIITTINNPNKVIRYFEELEGWDLIIVGDIKTPDKIYKKVRCIFLSIDIQNRLYPKLSSLLPLNHYARKNIGYLYAIHNHYDVIYETDDDTMPYDGLNLLFNTDKTIIAPKYVNICKLYSDKHIWPRGYPLENVNKYENISVTDNRSSIVHVIQGLVDLNPDVDAIFRLTNKNFDDGKFFFDRSKDEYVLGKGCYVPFNTQNTYWVNKNSFHLLYLPSTVSFRFCDILKSYIAQKVIWGIDGNIGYRYADVYQDRNDHDLMDDFRSEIPMYNNILKVVDILENSNVDLLGIYRILAKEGVVQPDELIIIEEWLKEIS